ncbi:hypothetical protein HY629_01195 [Candidatus Uhrbacteria bacterium]|nr:hypothetical protein [Candidatus Uhrbacteria bacterium]
MHLDFQNRGSDGLGQQVNGRMMTMATPLITSRDPKGLHAIGLFEAAYNKAGLDTVGAQRLNERGGEFQDGVIRLIAELSVSDRYADEEVESGYGYLSGYTPKSLAEQISRLHELFPNLGGVDPAYLAKVESGAIPLPAGAEGWFTIPRWEKVASLYGEAVEQILALINTAREGQFTNWREGELGPDRLRQTARSIAFWQKISDEQSGADILIVAGQFGKRHAGKSVRRGREVYTPSEFGLGSFAVGVMLLTHSERLLDYNDLWIDCGGDEYDDPGSFVRFGRAPYFHFGDGGVGFGTREVGGTDDYCGSASAFLPQSGS